MELSRKLLSDRDHAEKAMRVLSTLKICNLSYGYRMRLAKLRPNLRLKN